MAPTRGMKTDQGHRAGRGGSAAGHEEGGNGAPAAAAKPGRKKPGRKPGRRVAATAHEPSGLVAVAASSVDLIDRVFALADQCRKMGQLKRLVDRLAGGAVPSPRNTDPNRTR